MKSRVIKLENSIKLGISYSDDKQVENTRQVMKMF